MLNQNREVVAITEYKFPIDLYFERKLSNKEEKLLIDKIDWIARELFKDDYDGFGFPLRF